MSQAVVTRVYFVVGHDTRHKKFHLLGGPLSINDARALKQKIEYLVPEWEVKIEGLDKILEEDMMKAIDKLAKAALKTDMDTTATETPSHKEAKVNYKTPTLLYGLVAVDGLEYKDVDREPIESIDLTAQRRKFTVDLVPFGPYKRRYMLVSNTGLVRVVVQHYALRQVAFLLGWEPTCGCLYDSDIAQCSDGEDFDWHTQKADDFMGDIVDEGKWFDDPGIFDGTAIW